ncbi:MAG: hypothetical protein WB421_01035 [Terriglobales bacterium]
MKHWKQALIASSAGASIALGLQRRKTASLVLAGVGLVTLASEHAGTIKKLYRNLPDYLERGGKILEVASLIGTGVARFAESRGVTSGDEIGSI